MTPPCPALPCPPLSERKNVNLPGVVVDLPTLTDKDKDDLVQWAIPNDIDFIAASFVRKVWAGWAMGCSMALKARDLL